MDGVIPIVQTSILVNMKTGNPLVDALLAVLLLYITKKIVEIVPIIIDRIRTVLITKNKNVKSEYLIQGNVTISAEYCSHYINFPDEYKAVIYQINQLGIDIGHGRQFNKKSGDTDVKNTLFSYSVNTTDEIRITDDIFIKQENSIDKSNDLKASIEIYNLYVYSPSLSFVQLKNYIDIWVTDYKKYVREYNDGNLYFFSYIGSDNKKSQKDLITNGTKFEAHTFYSNKSFANIFFDKKDVLINRLNHFLTSEETYKKLGIPYTFGLLFHGEPGCGKTSTIKAIANYTKRHIIEISLSKIKTCYELKNVFFSELINGHYVPADKKIIVLEDIDCMGNLVTKRGTLSSENLSHSQVRRMMTNMVNEGSTTGSIRDSQKEQTKNDIYDKLLQTTLEGDYDNDNDDKLTLSYILNLIDGVLEQRGRILIITTNRPKDLDEALLRPGRIDIKIEFTKCSSDICRQIIEFYFDTSLLPKYNLPDYKWTPAEIFQICFNYRDIDTVISKLMITEDD